MNISRFTRQAIERKRAYNQITLANQLLVIDCLMDGYSNREIAEALSIAVSTVKRYISRISERLQISDDDWDLRNRIVYLTAIQRGLIKPYETNNSQPDSIANVRTDKLRRSPSSSRSNGAGNGRGDWNGGGIGHARSSLLSHDIRRQAL